MSTSPVDVKQYYQSYINANSSVSIEQFRSIQESWKTIHSGEYALFKEQTLVSDPVGFWGLQFYDVLFEIEPSLKPLFKNKFQQSKMLTEIVITPPATIRAIALDCGFANQSHFAKCFRKHTGMNPKKFCK